MIVTISREVLRVFATNEPSCGWVRYSSHSGFPLHSSLEEMVVLRFGRGDRRRVSLRGPNDCREASIPSPSPRWPGSGPSPPSSSMSQSVSDLLGLGNPAPYELLLAVFCLLCVALVWALLEALMASPWGRILKSIRRTRRSPYGHDVLTHKAASLALGAAIAGLAGRFGHGN